MNTYDKWIDKEREFTYDSRNGTRFESTCALSQVDVKNKPDNDAQFAQDVAEMVCYHLVWIHPKLNGFQGYDCTRYNIT